MRCEVTKVLWEFEVLWWQLTPSIASCGAWFPPGLSKKKVPLCKDGTCERSSRGSDVIRLQELSKRARPVQGLRKSSIRNVV